MTPHIADLKARFDDTLAVYLQAITARKRALEAAMERGRNKEARAYATMRHPIAGPLSAIALACAFAGAVPAQESQRPQTICPATVSAFPVDIRQQELPLRQQARFEIRVCQGGWPFVQILGFKSKATRPSLVAGTGSLSIELLIHSRSILVVQVTGGDSSPVYIAQFQKGKPVFISGVDGVGGVSYSEEHLEHGDYAIIKVPQKTFPGPDGKFPQRIHTFRLKIDDE